MPIARLTRRDFLRNAGVLVVGAPLLARGALHGSSATAQLPNELGILPRETWAADRPPTGPLAEETVRFLLVHHTVSSNHYEAASVPDLLRGFYDFHTSDQKGWNDIAYNFLIDRFGTIWEGRAGSLAGPVAVDATGGNQGFSQSCAIIGDFTDVMPSDESLEALITLLAWLADRYGIATAPGSTVTFTSRGSNRWPEGTAVTSEPIAGHRDMSETACPGDAFYPHVKNQLAVRVHEQRGTVTSPATTATTATTLSAAPHTKPEPAPSTTVSPAPSTIAATPTSPPPADGSGSDDLLSIAVGTGAATVAVAAIGALVYRRLRASERPAE